MHCDSSTNICEIPINTRDIMKWFKIHDGSFSEIVKMCKEKNVKNKIFMMHFNLKQVTRDIHLCPKLKPTGTTYYFAIEVS